MANKRRKHNEAMVNMYEMQRLATIAGNKRRLDALNIPTLSDMQQHYGQPKKRIKVCFICSNLYIYFFLFFAMWWELDHFRLVDYSVYMVASLH
jgi:hypothetical protein